jgi:hypothetical protein
VASPTLLDVRHEQRRHARGRTRPSVHPVGPGHQPPIRRLVLPELRQHAGVAPVHLPRLRRTILDAHRSPVERSTHGPTSRIGTSHPGGGSGLVPNRRRTPEARAGEHRGDRSGDDRALPLPSHWPRQQRSVHKGSTRPGPSRGGHAAHRTRTPGRERRQRRAQQPHQVCGGGGPSRGRSAQRCQRASKAIRRRKQDANRSDGRAAAPG